MIRYGVNVVAALAIGQWAAIAGAEGDSPYISTIPTALAANEVLSPDGDVMATLTVTDVDQVVATLGNARDIEVIAAGDGAVTVVLGDRATLAGSPRPGHVEPSFVIDYTEPVFDALIEQLEHVQGGSSARERLVDFVYEFIDDKNYLRGFDLASRVASTGEGDCTEHAVLLAALARASGRPARVVIGVLLAVSDGNVMGFGHAWTEIHEEGQWHIADATAPARDLPDLRALYVPMIVLENEGPGYAMDLARILRVHPAEVSDIANAP